MPTGLCQPVINRVDVVEMVAMPVSLIPATDVINQRVVVVAHPQAAVPSVKRFYQKRPKPSHCVIVTDTINIT
jgi:hypothetical protein